MSESLKEPVIPTAASRVAVTIIVPTFRSGAALQRVFDSIDAVTLPPGQLEVIFADDGSGDDTVARLHDFARARPYVRVLELENSGWPSRPRNAAIEQARGEYLLFMDHDDSLFPGALRRAYEFGVEHDADVVSPKESKTNDSWWSLQEADFGNTPDIRTCGGAQRMLPMVPHKLYRRQLLLAHDIRFPEGSRILWEDWYINVPSYRHGKVAALVDTAMYLWHASDTNTVLTFDPCRQDYWDRLADLFKLISQTLSGPEFDDDRNALIRHNVGLRVVQRPVRQLSARVREDPSVSSRPTAEESKMLSRASRMLWRYGSRGITRDLTPVQRAQARLLRLRRADWILSFQVAVESLTATVTATSVVWRAGVLHLELETRWETSDPDKISIVPDGRDGLLDLGRLLNFILPREMRSTSGAAASTLIALRDRSGRVSWPVATERTGAPVVTTTGITYRARAVIDPSTAATGGPIPDSVFDLRVRSTWLGLNSYGGIETRCPVAAMMSGSRQASAYRNAQGLLSLDLSGRLRDPALDARPELGLIGGVGAFRARLTALAVHKGEPRSVALAAIPLDVALDGLDADAQQRSLAELAEAGCLSARVAIRGDKAWLTGSARLPAGAYRIYSHRDGKWQRTRYVMYVAIGGIASLAAR